MRPVQSKSIKYLFVGLCATLSACGGGGGDGSAKDIPLTDSQLLAVAKSANSADWSLTIVDTLQSQGMSYLIGHRKTYFTFPALSGSNTNVLDRNNTPLCSSGRYTATWNFKSLDYYAVDDTITVDFSNCVRSSGATYNGSEIFSITSSTLNGTNYTTVTSNLNNLSYTSSKGSAISFSNADKITYTSSGTYLNNSYAYPFTYTTNASYTTKLVTTATNLEPGTYTVSNASMLTNYASDGNSTESASFNSSDGTYNDVIITNITPTKVTTENNITTTTYPKNSLTYSGATINLKTNSSSSTTMSGTNTDGSTFTTVDTGYGYSY
jgi:hypothetical protein